MESLQGIGDWMQIPVGILRTICIVVLVLTGFFPIIPIYAIAALLMPLESAHRSFRSSHRERDREQEYYQ